MMSLVEGPRPVQAARLRIFLRSEGYTESAVDGLLAHVGRQGTLETAVALGLLEPADLAGAAEAFAGRPDADPDPRHVPVAMDAEYEDELLRAWDLEHEESMRRLESERPDPEPEPFDYTAPPPVSGGSPSLAELVEAAAATFRRMLAAGPITAFIADQIEDLAGRVRFVGAASPEQYLDRIAFEEQGVREREYDRGYQDGRVGPYCPR